MVCELLFVLRLLKPRRQLLERQRITSLLSLLTTLPCGYQAQNSMKQHMMPLFASDNLGSEAKLEVKV